MLPRKVPALFAYEKLVDFSARNPEDMKTFSLQRVRNLGPNDLTPVGKLKIYFRSAGAFREFKADLLSGEIDQSYWQSVYEEHPGARKYVRKFYRPESSSNKRSRLKMKTFIGSPDMSDVSDDDSVLSVQSDDENINFPKPVCQGIRRVCRYYDAARRYRPYEVDNSENDRYVFRLRYN